MLTITYRVKNAVYVNLTNRCPCACKFCLRQNGPEIFGSGNLWLEREPTAAETIASLDGWDYTQFREVVFCGYGEPTERLDVLLEAAAHLKAKDPTLTIRVNTNGLADLIWNRDTSGEFVGKVDVLSISLNTDDPKEYLEVCRPKFGAAAYPAMLDFARHAAQKGVKTVMTVVDEPVTTKAQQERCRQLCASLGATLRVRPYEG